MQFASWRWGSSICDEASRFDGFGGFYCQDGFFAGQVLLHSSGRFRHWMDSFRVRFSETSSSWLQTCQISILVDLAVLILSVMPSIFKNRWYVGLDLVS